MKFFDTESVGLYGLCVLIQHATDNQDIKLHHVFREPVSATLDLCEEFTRDSVCGFNLVHDWFHITKLYNILRVLRDSGYTGIPNPSDCADIEATHPHKWCLKPRAACDLMLFARRGKYQSTMARKPIRIKRIPKVLSATVAEHLQTHIEIPAIYFEKRKTGYQWEVKPHELSKDKYDPNFDDITLTFAGSTSLRALAHDALGEDKADWPIPDSYHPDERSYRVYGETGPSSWRELIYLHIPMWANSEKAQYYAWKDVDITRKLWYHFDRPEPGDDDSELAVALGGTRWRGFAIDKSGISALKEEYQTRSISAPKAPANALRWLHEVMAPTEKLAVTSTGKPILESIQKWEDNPVAVERARRIQSARKATKRLELVEKLESISTFHPEFKIIGTRSNRMAGGTESKSDSINPQGIPREREFRCLFTLADRSNDEELWGGDATSYEPSIMAAVFKDAQLTAALSQGKKFHALMGSKFYKMSYDEVLGDKDGKYLRAKIGGLAFFYGAQENKLADVLNIPVEEAKSNIEDLYAEFPGIAKERAKIFDMFCSMRQPGGIGTRIEWHEPAEYIESIFGFRRYFTLENLICKALFDLANKPPAIFKEYKGQLTRRDRIQTPGGAAQSAIYAAAFNIQAMNLRQAGNHVIQSPGGQMTKKFQRMLCDLQPQGIHEWVIRTFNVHDELLVVVRRGLDTIGVRNEFLETYRKYVPLLGWEWKRLNSWGDKE